MTSTKVKTVARCIFPNGKAVLAGYGENEKLLVGIVVKTKNVVNWARAGVTSADWKRVEQAVIEQERNEKGSYE